MALSGGATMSWELELYRASGAGNDFLAVVEPPAPPSAREIRAWCTRGLSLGADGFFALYRQADGVRMDYWNADGEPAKLCLNGTRCAARLAFALGWAEQETVIETGAGRLTARAAGPGRIAVELPPLTEPIRDITLHHEGELLEGIFVDSGVPHLVLPLAGALGAAPVARLGPVLRRHPLLGAAGANVNWVRYVSPTRLEIRSFERGVEAETLACGTGVVAAVAAGLIQRKLELPVTALTLGGFELEVGGTRTVEHPLPDRFVLTGDARLLARLTVSAEAQQLPTPPSW